MHAITRSDPSTVDIAALLCAELSFSLLIFTYTVSLQYSIIKIDNICTNDGIMIHSTNATTQKVPCMFISDFIWLLTTL